MFVKKSSRRATLIRQLVVLALISLTTGCAGQFNNWLHNGFKVGPDYMKPAAQVADEYPTPEPKVDPQTTLSDLKPKKPDGKPYDGFKFAPDAPGLPPTEITAVTDQPHDHSQWWTVFNDPHLNKLIAIASQFGNHDVNAFAGAGSNRSNESLREAALRVLQAREALGIARGNLAPQQQDAFFDYQKRQGSRQTFPTNRAAGIFLPKRSHSFWDLGLSATWELDIWGRFRRAIEAGEAELDFTTEDYDALLVSILADVAQTYFRIRTLEQALYYTRANVDAQKGVLEILYPRSGEIESELPLRQSETSLFTTQCLVPEIELQIQLQKHLLCFLLNRPADPKNIRQLLGDSKPGPDKSLIPSPPRHVAVGIPADLMRRRPDLRAVERQVAAQSARIGIAASDLFPTVSILGSVQYEAEFLGDLVAGNSVAGVFGGPAIRWPILNYYRIRNNINVQDAVFQELAARYERTVLQANREVADSIVSFLKFQEQAEYCRRAANAARRSVEIATVRVKKGEKTAVDELFPLQIVKATADNDLARAQGAVIQELIAIYRNLGGGWQIRLNPPPQVEYAKIESIAPPAPENGRPLLPEPPAAGNNGAPQAPLPGNGGAPQPTPMPEPPAGPNDAGPVGPNDASPDGGGPAATMMRFLPPESTQRNAHAWQFPVQPAVVPVGHWERQPPLPGRQP